MASAERRTIGSTSTSVSALGIGCGPLGGLFTAVDADRATAAVSTALASGLSYVDVAPFYGLGLAEERVGAALRGVPRASYTLSTKVGRLIVDDPDAGPDPLYVGAPGRRVVFDFSRDGVLRSLDASLERLGLDRIDIVYIHDPDDHFEQAVTEAFPALVQLRSEGVIGAIGAGMNQSEMLARFVQETDMDVVLCAGRYTLLDPSAADLLFPHCQARGVSVVMGGVFNSGVLADPYADNLYYNYGPAPAPVVRTARELAAICARHDTPLPAAALQFALRHDAVTSVLTGVRSSEELCTNLELAQTPISAELWEELDNAIAERSSPWA